MNGNFMSSIVSDKLQANKLLLEVFFLHKNLVKYIQGSFNIHLVSYPLLQGLEPWERIPFCFICNLPFSSSHSVPP